MAQKWHNIFVKLTLSNVNRFSKLFHCRMRRKFAIILSLKIPTHLKCVATPREMSLKGKIVEAFHWWRHWSVASPAWVHCPAARRTHWTFDVSRSSAMAEGPRDALVSIEKKLAIDEWPWHTPKVITVAAIKWPYGISLPVCGLLFQCLYLAPFSRHQHFWSERDCLWPWKLHFWQRNITSHLHFLIYV